MKALILAAGYGQRFQPYSLQLAKPALPLFDVPIIAHAIYYLHLINVRKLIINIHHLPETIKDAVRRLRLSQEVSWSFEPSILGSGGGIYNVNKFFEEEEHFLVVNGDCVFSAPNKDFLHHLVEAHRQKKALATLLSCPHEGLGVDYSALWCDGDQIRGIGHQSPQPHLTPRHYTGLMVLSGKVFEYFSGSPGKPSNIFLNVILPAIQNGELIQSFHVDYLDWYETGNLHSYLDTQKSLLIHMNGKHPNANFVSSIYKHFLDYEVSINDSLQWISPHSTLDETSRAKMGHNVVICSGAQIGREISIDNSVVSWRASLPTATTIHSQMVL